MQYKTASPNWANVRQPSDTCIVDRGLDLGMLLTALDFNIVATAVPIISSELKEYNTTAWLGDGFLITFALVLPITA